MGSASQKLPDHEPSDRLVSYDALMKISGYSEPAEIREWLERNNVRYMVGKYGRPFTSIDAVNSALGIAPESIDVTSVSRKVTV